jgi:riboflavin biosynthesis pyrimidine reductase
MKPYVICHMNSSVDGRILGSRSRPAENRMAGLVERPHDELAGERALDLGVALDILNRELGIERLRLEGGGGSNGAFLRAGLIDEISPAIDGAKGAPSVFDSGEAGAGIAAPVRWMVLASTELLEGGVVGLRYRLLNG